MGPIQTLDDVFDMVRRRMPAMLFVICAGVIVSVWVALNHLHMFSSTEVVQVEHSQVADELTSSTIAGLSGWHLQAIKQRLMARDSLLQVIDEFDLYADLPNLQPSEKVSLLRQAIQIQGITPSGERALGDAVISAVTTTATMKTPQQAQAMADVFSKKVIDLSASSRIAEARETLDFFVLQGETLTARVAALERRIAAFGKRIQQQVTETGPQALQELASFERQLEKLQTQLSATTARRAGAEVGFRLESQHRSERMTVLEPAGLSGHPVTLPHKLVVLIGVMMSIITAFAVALVLEIRDPVIRTANQMQRELGFPPVASIPFVDDSPNRSDFLRRALSVFKFRRPR